MNSTSPEKWPRPDTDPPEPAAGSISARAAAAATPPYLDGLNPEQYEAATTLDGPLLVLAGAGTGKTRVLTTRIAHILTTRRAFPGQILAVTFTNKAAREMKNRIGKLIGGVAEGMPWLGTFHSIGAKILRRHAELVDLKSDFTILDTDDQIRLLKQVLAAENIDDKRWPARQFAWMIDNWKNRGQRPKDISGGDGFSFAGGRGGELYGLYQSRLKALNAVDFGDLLLEMIRLFQDNPDILAEYQNRFRFTLVDEYQDTNVAQYLWLRLLAQTRTDEDGETLPQNICCVGDDDQSIYGWRGAEVENILRFDKDFPGAKIIRLERNYRSTSHILQAASHLISHNEGRLGKELHSVGEDGERVAVRGVWDGEEEARAIGEDIEQFQRKKHNLNEIAILVRASFQMLEFEDRFVTLGLPYRVIGGPRFYERKEIRDALAYLKIISSSANDLAFERIINVPRRGLGDATLKVIHALARSQSISLFDAARILAETEELNTRSRRSLASLMAMFERWQNQKETSSHTELAEIVLDESGYTEMWQKDRAADAPGRLENLKELVRSMQDFENLAGFLEHISLVMDTEANSEETDKVNLMTLHAAKGLEFDTVFLPGWEEGLFPHQRTLDESGRAGLEEERRLAYVGLTRARKMASVSFAQNRRIHALWQSALPSRFLDELPAAHVKILENQNNYGASMGNNNVESRFDRNPADFSGNYNTPGWQRAQQQHAQPRTPMARSGPKQIDGEIVGRDTGSGSSQMLGNRVFHQKFGYGEVMAVDGDKLTVEFDKAGTKRVLASFVEQH